MARELGPMMVAILLAGRVGSAITAELASMKVYQEVDALVTMNIPPARMLVLPRLAAVLVMMPVLTIIGEPGRLVRRRPHLPSTPALDRHRAPRPISPRCGSTRNSGMSCDGLAKAEVFGFVVVLVCCNIGLNTRGGPREIGAAVTRSVVVISLILILVLDYFVTKIQTS